MKRKFKPDLLIIIILLTIMNVPLLSGATPFYWDTFNMPYEEFTISYNAIYHHNALPLWLPYSSYGMPDYFWLAALSIVNIFFLGAGALFKVQNALMLFKLSLFGEQLIAVFGMYLLANQIFKKRTTVLLTCLAFMGTFGLYRQVQFNFRMTYLLPLILFWIILFFQRKSPVFLWLTGLTIIFSVPGSGFYPLVIEFYSIAIFTFILFIFYPQAARAVFKLTRGRLIVFAGLVIVALIFLYYFSSFGNGVEVLRAGRGANLSVSISDFLSQWKAWNPLALAASFLYGVIPHDLTNGYEYLFYIGLLPLAGVIGAVLYQRTRLWYAVLAAAIFLYAISLNGYFSFAAYFLPFIDITRYVPILGTVPFRTFLILAAGFGLDADFSSAQLKKIALVLLGFAISIDILGAISTSENAASKSGYRELLSNPAPYTFDFKLFIIRLGTYLLLIGLVLLIYQWNKKYPIRQFPLEKFLIFGLIVLTIFDLGLYRLNYEKKVQGNIDISKAQVMSLPSLRPFLYQEQRLFEPQNENDLLAMKTTSMLDAEGHYILESFIQFDRCMPYKVSETNRFEVFSSSLSQMVENDLVFTSAENASVGLKQIYGCEFPKLRVVSNVNVSPTNQEALEKIKVNSDFSNLLILSSENSQVKTALNNLPPEADIRVVSFSPNRLQVDVDLKGDKAWLVYSDSYHTDWQVKVSGRNEKIEQAYLAFKAVPILQGMNHVEFNYGSPWKFIGSTSLAVLCGAAALLLLSGIFITLFFDHSLLSKDLTTDFFD